MLKNSNFPGLWGSLLGELALLNLLAGGEETRCPLSNNPTPVLGRGVYPYLPMATNAPWSILGE